MKSNRQLAGAFQEASTFLEWIKAISPAFSSNVAHTAFGSSAERYLLVCAYTSTARCSGTEAVLPGPFCRAQCPAHNGYLIGVSCNKAQVETPGKQ